jgi:regulator of RNase E activity RraB
MRRSMPTDKKLLAMLKKSADPDAKVLVQLAKHGSDLGKVHAPDFALVIPSEKSALQAAATLKKRGFSVRVDRDESPDNGFWVIATRKMMLELSALQQLAIEMQALAEEHDGDYDGWGAEIVE